MIYGVLLMTLIGAMIAFFLVQNQKSAIVPIDFSSEPRCDGVDAKYLNAALSTEERVDDLMKRMNDAEKIGQMVIIEKDSIQNVNDISHFNLGALLSGGGGAPKENTPQAWLAMVQTFQSAAANTCLGIPLLYGTDAIHGHNNVFGATIFPHAIALGATRDADLVRRIAKATAEEMAATGIYWSYSPNLDVPQDSRWGKTYETFGSDTDNVTQLGAAYLAGTQESSTGYFNVLATAKHFLGGGAMEYGTSRNKDFKIEEGNITLDEQALRGTHLTPFHKAVTEGVQTIMVGTAAWNGIKNPSNQYLLTDVLKKELGFSGFIVSDWYAVYILDNDRYRSLVMAINAGVDMVMTPFEYKDFVSNMQAAIHNGDISRDRLDDAVRRILTVKFKTGLFDRPAATANGLSVIGNQKHKELARQAVAASQVVLKNSNDILPLSSSVKKIFVAGSGADNLGRQSGGWTVEWQGVDGNWLPGTTILAGIKNTVSKDTQVEYNVDANFASKQSLADVGIAVVSEKTYAEGWGDNEHPRLSNEDLAAINKLKKQSKKLVVLIVAGRPLEISPYSSTWDGVVASWLPGSEGQGVADVLFGLKPFTGQLPIEWNR